ncbi:endonuclease domain-containing protein [Bacteroides helcogenes]|uniref:endonuclease domain-containing protein n=1 Tax=Bacteroides helcogenes TaxID=290053 RepID=UPI002A916F96|nr:endonuclease domain-containing protein [Bacteroides helcogenes]MDY5238402.1 endonuclease domain-containing protein [Bacteroides helcogenes]
MQTIMNTPEKGMQRKELRNHSTPAEATLWKMLKGEQVAGLKFRRQHSVGPYILDFFCPEIKLAIELDGEVHNKQEEYDEQRTHFLQKTKGIEVLRFENRTVFENAELIIREIEEKKSFYYH